MILNFGGLGVKLIKTSKNTYIVRAPHNPLLKKVKFLSIKKIVFFMKGKYLLNKTKKVWTTMV